MISTTHLFCLTRWRDIFVAYGHAMPCAPIFFEQYERSAAGGAIVPLTAGFQGIGVPISRGGPPARTE